MSRGAKYGAYFLILMSITCTAVSSQSVESEKQRLADAIEQIVKTYGSPLDRGGAEYFSASINAGSGSVSLLYDDVDGRRRGKLFQVNYLFNLKDIDPSRIEVHGNPRFWTIRLWPKEGDEIPVHSIMWSGKTKKNEDSWWADFRIEQFGGLDTEERARELAGYLRRLIPLYQ